MPAQPKNVVTGAPWSDLTYRIIGLAMELHNELGLGHREAAYHNGLAIKMQAAGLSFESEPYSPIGRRRLEYKRLFPPVTVQAYRREKWGRPDR